MAIPSFTLKSTANAVFICVLVVYVVSPTNARNVAKGGLTKGQEEIGPIDNYTCTDDGAFPHEECDLFVTCWNGSATLHRCTEIQLFDLRYDGCNWAEYVDCQDRHRPPGYPQTTTPPTTSTTTDPSVTNGPTTPPPNGTFDCPSNGLFPHEEKCEYYWNCYDGVALLLRCEFDYLFDLTYLGCNFPDLTDCGDRERPPPTGTSTTVAPPDSTLSTTTESSGGGSTSPGDNSTVTGGPSTTTKPPGGDFQCPENNGVFPDPEDCTTYYVCIDGVPTHAECPEGLHFNPDIGQCDWPDEAGCEIKRDLKTVL